MGRSRPAVANALRLLSLDHDTLALVEEGKLSAGHARALLPIPDAKSRLAAANEVIKKGLSVRKTELLSARRVREAQGEKKGSPDGVDYAADVAERLSGLLGRRVRLVAFSSSRGSSDPGIEPLSLMSPDLAGGLFTTSATGYTLHTNSFSQVPPNSL